MPARGIDIRERGAVVEAYKFNGKPNWGLFAGNEPIVVYEDGDPEEGETKLDNYLSIIEDSPTRTVYMLRVYNPDVTRITNKSPYSGSATFMLNKEADVTTDPKTGLTVITRGSDYPKENSSFIMQRLDKLEQENKRLTDALHNQQLTALNEKLDRAISGLTPPEPHWTDKLADTLTKDPGIISKTFGELFSIFKGEHPRTNYIVNPMGKTQQLMKETAEPVVKEPEHKEKELTDKEVDELQGKQNEACDNLDERLGTKALTGYLTGVASLTDEHLAMWWQQQHGLDTLNIRIGMETVTKMINQVAALNDKDLNKLLNHLD